MFKENFQGAYFSACLLDDMVTLHGLPQVPEKLIGKKAAVARILCTEHNTALSELDSEMKGMKEVFLQIHNDLSQNEDPTLVGEYPKRVNGINFERWCLKTLINLLRAKDESFYPGWLLVELAYGVRNFEPEWGQGLYFIDPELHQNRWVNQGKMFFAPKMFSPAEVIKDPEELAKVGVEPQLWGCFVNVFGFHFWLRTLSCQNIGMSVNGVQIDRPELYRQKSFFLTRTKLDTPGPVLGKHSLIDFIY